MIPEFDLLLFNLINQTLTHPALDVFFVFITGKYFWIPLIITGFSYLLIFGKKRGRIVVILLFITVSYTDFSTYRWLKPTFKRLRPCHSLENVRKLERCGGKWSMPSNHASNFFAAAVILSLFYRKYKTYFFSIAFLIGAYSRIYVGKHYPADVLVGALYGMLSALVIYYFWVSIRTRLEKQEKYFLSLSK